MGIKLLFLISGEANEQDQVSHKCSFIFLAIICLFSCLIVYLSLCKGRELRAIKKEIVKRKVKEYVDELESQRSKASVLSNFDQNFIRSMVLEVPK